MSEQEQETAAPNPKLAWVLGLNPKYEPILPLTLVYGGQGAVFAIYSLVTGGVATLGVYFFAGAFVFSFVDYAYHIAIHEISSYHVDHHRIPHDPELSIFDLCETGGPYVAVCAFCVFGTPSLAAAAAAAAGFVLHYVYYEWMHFLCHRPHPDGLMQWQKIMFSHHLRHHFGNSKRDFGVTTPFWDVVFGTLGDPNWRWKGDHRPSVDSKG